MKPMLDTEEGEDRRQVWDSKKLMVLVDLRVICERDFFLNKEQ